MAAVRTVASSHPSFMIARGVKAYPGKFRDSGCTEEAELRSGSRKRRDEVEGVYSVAICRLRGGNT